MPSADDFSFFSTAAGPDVALMIGSADVEGPAVPVDPERVQAILLEAAEQQSAVGRAALLDRQCSADAELRQRVETLLRAHDAPGAFLESPAPVPVATVDELPITEGPGT